MKTVKRLWNEMTKTKKVAALVIALVCVALFVWYFLTTDHAVFALIKCALTALAASPVLLVLFCRWDRIKALLAGHKRSFFVICVLELFLFGYMFTFFFLVIGVSELYRIVQFGIALLMAVMIFLTYVELVLRKKELHQVFWKVAVVMGAVFLILQPPGTPPDEETHWRYAYHEANLITGISLTEEGTIPMREEDARTELKPLSNGPNDYVRYWYSLGEDEGRDAWVPTGATPYSNRTTGYQYWPQALGLLIGRGLGLGGALTFFLGRLPNLAVYILMATYALKKLPFGKMALFLTALMPMSLQQAASLSPDAMINGCALLIVALSLHLAYTEEKPSIPEYLVLLAACFLLLPLKGYTYGFLCLFPLLIVFRKWKTQRKEAVLALAILAGCLALLALYRILPFLTQSDVFSEHSSVTYNGEVEYSLQVLLRDPREIFRIIFNNFIGYDAFYLESMIASPLQWLNVEVNRLFLYAFVVLLAFSGLRRSDEEVQMGLRAKLYVHLLCWATVAAVFLAMLLAYSPVSAHRVEGVQGRYLIPCLFPMLVTLRSRGASISQKHETGILVAAQVVLFGVVQWVMMTR